MARPITSAAQFAEELASYVYLNALGKREVRSLAKSIQYPIGLLNPTNKSRLRGQLAFLDAFIGTLALGECLGECAQLSSTQIQDIAADYRKRLLTRCIPEEMLPEYETRRRVWCEFFAEPIELDATMRLASSFYELLTRRKCPEVHGCVLALRFNQYIDLFRISVHRLAQDLRLPGDP